MFSYPREHCGAVVDIDKAVWLSPAFVSQAQSNRIYPKANSSTPIEIVGNDRMYKLAQAFGADEQLAVALFFDGVLENDTPMQYMFAGSAALFNETGTFIVRPFAARAANSTIVTTVGLNTNQCDDVFFLPCNYANGVCSWCETFVLGDVDVDVQASTNPIALGVQIIDTSGAANTIDLDISLSGYRGVDVVKTVESRR